MINSTQQSYQRHASQ